jgi:hypothetical protein
MNIQLIISCSILLFGCAQSKSINNTERFSKETNIIDDTPKITKYEAMFDEDAKIMSQWTEEEKLYFYEHFVFSFEELEEELGIKLRH